MLLRQVSELPKAMADLEACRRQLNDKVHERLPVSSWIILCLVLQICNEPWLWEAADVRCGFVSEQTHQNTCGRAWVG